jgi:hypothetical protein
MRLPRNAGLTTLLLAVLAQAAASSKSAVDVSQVETSSRQFTQAIDALKSLDPQSPETLNTRLDYAEFLAKAQGGDCQWRLDRAQEQLELVRTSPVLEIALPLGSARASDLGYQIHFARASCGDSASVHEQELRAALDDAQRAVELYRNALDAVSMVTMQYNTAVANQRLGNGEAAIAALQTTLQMDREYGYEDDARENYQLLLRWTGKDAGPEALAQQMVDFPRRTTTLNFAWLASDSDVSIDTEHAQSANGVILHIRGSRSAQRRIREGLQSWVVSYVPREVRFDFDTPPSDDPSEFAYANSLARMLLQLHDFDLARHGDFDESKGGFTFGARARGESKQLAQDLAAKGAGAASIHAFHKALEAGLTQDSVEGFVAEDYNLQTGTWIGASLEQGVWYDMEAPLSMPLAASLYEMHKIQFAYTRAVPCTADATDSACVEIVLRATPDPEKLETDLPKLADLAHLRRAKKPRLWSVTFMRLVTDPATLQPYVLDLRRHSYWSSGATGPSESLTESEKTLFVSGKTKGPADF